MNPLLSIGTKIVVVALLAYTVASVLIYKKRSAANVVVWFQSLGLVFDITATVFMIIGSTNTPFSVHGFLGYTALLGMLIKTFFLWRFRFQKGKEAPFKPGFHLLSKIAYGWWVTAFVVGALLVFLI